MEIEEPKVVHPKKNIKKEKKKKQELVTIPSSKVELNCIKFLKIYPS